MACDCIEVLERFFPALGREQAFGKRATGGSVFLVEREGLCERIRGLVFPACFVEQPAEEEPRCE